VRDADLSDEEQKQFHAAKWMFEYDFYRQVSNFAHHYNRTQVEAMPETVACRKMFYLAEVKNLEGSPLPSLNIYLTPVQIPGAGDWERRKLSPLEAWRDLVLMKNKNFRRDTFIQEQTAEIQVRFMRLYNRAEDILNGRLAIVDSAVWALASPHTNVADTSLALWMTRQRLTRYGGRALKEKIGAAATLLPLAPKFTNDTFGPPVFLGPFEISDSEGVPLFSDQIFDQILDRMHLPPRRPRPTGPPPGMGPGRMPRTPGAPIPVDQ
jgi:hypothetical protein